jgi:hypothetical protein
VSITNVAPTATKAFDTSVNEGSSFSLALTSPSDPSSADTTAGFEYRFDCGSGYGAWGTDSSTSCSTTDNGTRNVKAEIRDKDLTPVSTYTGSVTVENVPPTATFEYPSGTVNEGSSFTLKLTNPSDPAGTNDTLSYAFDCGDGNGFVADSDGVASCSTNDNGTRNVRGKIMDDDNGATEYPTSGTVSVTVNNVNPAVGALSLSGNNATACLSGNTVTLNSVSFTDAGTADTHTGVVNWGDGSQALTISESGGSGSTNSLQHTYATAGTRTITVTITDDDSGSGTSNGTASNLYKMSGILSPFNTDGSSTWKYGATIPVKVQITDCNNQPVSGLAPKVGATLYSSATPPTTINEDVYSTSGADTGNVMRYDATAGQYIYNFNSKSNAISDQNAIYWMSVKGLNSANQVVTSAAQVDQKFGIRSK